MIGISRMEFGEAWVDLLEVLMGSGIESAPRGKLTKELIPVTFQVYNGYSNILVSAARKLGYRFMLAEWLWIISGRDDVSSISLFNREIAKFSDDGQTFFGAYGPHVVSQLPYVIRKLRQDKDTRQAVISIWQPSPPETKDVPCTLTVQFLIRGKLHVIINMRSSDAWLGLPYDFFTFSMIGNAVAADLGLYLGSVTFNLGSSHLYESDFAGVNDVLANEHVTTLDSPQLPYMNFFDLQLKLFDCFKSAVRFKEDLSIMYWPTIPIIDGYRKALISASNQEALDVLSSLTS